ncbi:hypothetical protein [Marinagarivorans cellulosilyticus]|uniref:Flagellar protein FliT n=1 Tax=Marinagarivorans cellulosilyticus TaxID=2721545 RepID=A0AAN1WKV7_9GAMM|nr:hypothetical protein [Marinagarivorans cellulosilyticus]BCD99476.1 hypothetical protein MARGE09_P3678 [Marinagarivorans cellulosilyticus]
MPLVCSSLVDVIRTRKAMQTAFEVGDWDGVKACDERLGRMLDAAFSDDNRDNTALVAELEKVLAMYARVVTYLPEATAQRWLCATQTP